MEICSIKNICAPDSHFIYDYHNRAKLQSTTVKPYINYRLIFFFYFRLQNETVTLRRCWLARETERLNNQIHWFDGLDNLVELFLFAKYKKWKCRYKITWKSSKKKHLAILLSLNCKIRADFCTLFNSFGRNVWPLNKFWGSF